MAVGMAMDVVGGGSREGVEGEAIRLHQGHSRDRAWVGARTRVRVSVTARVGTNQG